MTKKANKLDIFVECFYGNEFSGDVKYTTLKIKEEYKNYNINVVYSNEIVKEQIVKYGLNPIKINSLVYYKTFYKCKYIISNLNLYRRLEKNNNQKFIQTWHGFPIKKMVKELKNIEESKRQFKEFSIDMNKWDLLLSPSNKYTEELDKSFKLNKNLEILYSIPPRIEYVLKEYKPLKKILYAPTWRSYQINNVTTLDLNKIAEETGYEIVIKPHPHDIDNWKNFKNTEKVYVDFKCIDIYEHLIETEILITDVSSIMFDFLLVSNKLILNSHDLNKYNDEIGLKFSVNELGNFEIKNYRDDEIINIINNNLFEEQTDFCKKNVLGNYESINLKQLLK